MFIGCKANFITAPERLLIQVVSDDNPGKKPGEKNQTRQVNAVGLIGCNLRKV
jgi:hypothetical protein